MRVWVQDVNRNTARHLAMQRELSDQVLDVLLHCHHGGDAAKALNNQGRTPLLEAIRMRDTAAVVALTPIQPKLILVMLRVRQHCIIPFKCTKACSWMCYSIEVPIFQCEMWKRNMALALCLFLAWLLMTIILSIHRYFSNCTDMVSHMVNNPTWFNGGMAVIGFVGTM